MVAILLRCQLAAHVPEYDESLVVWQPLSPLQNEYLVQDALFSHVALDCELDEPQRLSQTRVGVRNDTRSSRKRDCNHNNSAVAFAMPQYSASALERATRVCFLELQETKFGPRKRHEPDVER